AVSNNVASDLQRSTVTIQHRAVTLADDVVNPLRTWIDILPTALTQLLGIFGKGVMVPIPYTWTETPFPVAQQLAANGLQYATEYVESFQGAAANGVAFFTGTGGAAYSFPELLQGASADFASGNITGAFADLYSALYYGPLYEMGLPLFGILHIPTYMMANLSAATDYLVNPGVTDIFLAGPLSLPQDAWTALGDGLQGVYDSWTAGDPLGVLTNLLNIPGAMTNAVVNGIQSPGIEGLYQGLLSYPQSSLIGEFVNILFPGLANAIVAPNAQNIVAGGSLRAALDGFLHVLLHGWPSLTGAGEAAASVASVTDFATAASAAALPAGLPGIAPSIAADLSSIGPSVVADLASRLPVEFGTLAANVLTSLF
ncbi:hypothetical protein, partial [Mycobacterium malmoense]